MPTSSGLAPPPRGAEPPKAQLACGATEITGASLPNGALETELDLAAARRAARQHLPSPAEVAKEIALALFEVEAGCRSAAQLERVCTPELWDRLEHQVRRHGGLLPSHGDLIRVHFQELVPGIVNTVALVQRGPRVQPVAMRLDACSGRWLVTELRY